MDSLVSRLRESHKAQLAVAALAGSVATAVLLTAYNDHNKRKERRELQRDALQSVNGSTGRKANGLSSPQPPPEEILLDDSIYRNPNAAYDDNLIREQLARNYAFFGEEGMAKIRGATVVVVGCGGVGSWAAVMLVRS